MVCCNNNGDNNEDNNDTDLEPNFCTKLCKNNLHTTGIVARKLLIKFHKTHKKTTAMESFYSEKRLRVFR